jgi:hypothetical protein
MPFGHDAKQLKPAHRTPLGGGLLLRPEERPEAKRYSACASPIAGSGNEGIPGPSTYSIEGGGGGAEVRDADLHIDGRDLRELEAAIGGEKVKGTVVGI